MLPSNHDIFTLEVTLSGNAHLFPPNCLSDAHLAMVRNGLEYRHRVPFNQATNQPLKVRVVPISLFSDDTSGNRSKKWICFDSWIMNISAFSLTESNKYENHFFLCTSNHKVTAMEMVPHLTKDLMELEHGKVMFDTELNQEVFVIAPVLLFRGDNVRQAEIALNKGSMANHPCRYCYWQSDPSKPVDGDNLPMALRYTAETYEAEFRTNFDCTNFVSGTGVPDVPVNRGRLVRRNNTTTIMAPSYQTDLNSLSFKLTGAESLLKLGAVDLSKDLPVEILHTLLLVMTKYCFKIAWRCTTAAFSRCGGAVVVGFENNSALLLLTILTPPNYHFTSSPRLFRLFGLGIIIKLFKIKNRHTFIPKDIEFLFLHLLTRKFKL